MNQTEKSFREWVLTLLKQLEAKGLTLAGDSGQIDWTPDPENQTDLQYVKISFGVDNE